MKTENILEIKDHSLFLKSNKKITNILDHISLNIKKGEVLGIVGESGCGKTMLGNSIIGMYPSNLTSVQGEMVYNGVDLLPLSSKIRNQYKGKRISMIFQNPNTSLNPVITIGKQMMDVIRKHEKITKKIAKNTILDWLGKVGLHDPEAVYMSYPHQLSGGMKQRVVIAMVLSCNPELIVADEPTTALDVTTQYQILQLLQNLQKEHGVSIILITHDIGVASYICDRLMVMYAGQVVEVGPTDAILSKPIHPYTKGLFECLPGNGRSVDELHTIPGTVPNPTEFPLGCRFIERCSCAGERCRTEKPSIQYLPDEETRGYSCFYPEKGDNGNELE